MRIILSIVFTLLSMQVQSQNYVPVQEAADIKFTIKNFGVNTSGSLQGLQATIRFNEADLRSCSFHVSVDANTVNTGNTARDNHLRKEEYLDVEKHPKISFISTQVTRADKSNTYMLAGTLTIKGISRGISFPFTAIPQNEGLLFTGSVKINRRDFKVGGSSMVLSDNLVISLSVPTKKMIP
jgi:polyisoprenoid-binding protein YceI